DPSAAPLTGLIPTNTFLDLAPGNYYVKGTSVNTDNCETKPFPITIHDVSQDPKINVALVQPDFSCDGMNPTGQLAASASDPVSGDVNNFTYEWFAGTDTSVPALPAGGNPAQANNLSSGQYTLKV